jgi:hypothetical protein
MANRARPGQDPIGKQLKVGAVNSQSKWTTIEWMNLGGESIEVYIPCF